MKRLALAGIVLLSAVPVYLITGNAVAGKGKRRKPPPAAAKARTRARKAAIYGPMTVRAVPKAPKPADPAVREEKCFECHDEIQALKTGGKHGKVNCTSCHDGTADHLKDSDKRPATRVDLETCGGCHPDQYASFAHPEPEEARAHGEVAPHGARPEPVLGQADDGARLHEGARQPAQPRLHARRPVDRRPGVRRAVPAEERLGVRLHAGTGERRGTYLVDRYPESKEHKAFLPESAAAANPTCLQCKTQDKILEWKYLGDKDERAKWNRGLERGRVREGSEHGAELLHLPRPARGEAPDRPGRPDPGADPPGEGHALAQGRRRRTKIERRHGVPRRLPRRSPCWRSTTRSSQCGQCHVEYNCNPGFDPKTGEYSIKVADPRTNHFPFKDVLQTLRPLQRRSGSATSSTRLTGGLLWKAQHPEAETFWNSTHDKAGASCDDCHMPKVQEREGEGVHLPLADQPAELPQADVPHVEVPPGPDGGDRRTTRSTRSGSYTKGQDAQGRVLALGADRQDRRGEEGRARRPT